MKKMYATGKQQDRCLLVGIENPGQSDEENSRDIIELARLVETAGGIACASRTQMLKKADPATFLRKGKIREIKQYIKQNDIDALVFDEELTPHQIRNLEQFLDMKIVDRTELILHIFSRNARTRLAKLEVELAKMQYTLPRLKRMWTHLSRQKGGIGLKGPGERQIELDRRIILKKIAHIKKSLERIKRGMDIRQRKRSNTYIISLVGYTNSGKSSLLARLAEQPVLVADQLFSTLDTLVRPVALNEQRTVLFSDTVGFIRKLPLQLVNSFYATLAEILSSDLIIHVVDISNRDFERQMQAVEETLYQIGTQAIPIMNAFNKIDRLDRQALSVRLEGNRRRASVRISALTGENVPQLKQRVLQFIHSLEEKLRFKLLLQDQQGLALLHQVGEVVEVKKADGFVAVDAYIAPARLHLVAHLPHGR